MYFSKRIYHNLKALSGGKSNTHLGSRPEGYLEDNLHTKPTQEPVLPCPQKQRMISP